MPPARPRLPDETVERIRRSRRYPRLTQPDFLLLRRIVQTLTGKLGGFTKQLDVLDVFCGTRPYEDLLPPGSRCTGFDVDDHYGTADVLGEEFLPFEERSFDLVLLTEAFFLLPDPVTAAQELRRVLRPGGTLVLTVPLVWEYSRDMLEHRYTGPQLAALFDEGWEGTAVTEVGGYAVAWATLTGRILRAMQEVAVARRPALARIVLPMYAAANVALNGIAVLLDRFERRLWRPAPYVLPADLMLTARRAKE